MSVSFGVYSLCLHASAASPRYRIEKCRSRHLIHGKQVVFSSLFNIQHALTMSYRILPGSKNLTSKSRRGEAERGSPIARMADSRLLPPLVQIPPPR